MLVRGRLIQRNEKICVLKHISTLLCIHFCHRNFSEHAECLGGILGLKSSRLPDLHSRKSPKTFGMLQKVLRHIWLERTLNVCFKTHSLSFRRISLPPPHTHAQTQAKSIIKVTPDSANRPIWIMMTLKPHKLLAFGSLFGVAKFTSQAAWLMEY